MQDDAGDATRPGRSGRLSRLVSLADTRYMPSGLALLLAAALSAGTGAGGREEKRLGVGTCWSLDVPSDVRGWAARSDGSLEVRAEERAGRRQLVLTGVAQGVGELFLFRHRGPARRIYVRVQCKDAGCDFEEGRISYFRDSPRLATLRDGGNVVLRGYFGTIPELYTGRTGGFVCKATLDPVVIEELHRRADEALLRAGLGRLRARLRGPLVVIEGPVADEAQRRTAEAMAAPIFAALLSALR